MVDLESETVWSFTLGIKVALFQLVLIMGWSCAVKAKSGQVVVCCMNLHLDF